MVALEEAHTSGMEGTQPLVRMEMLNGIGSPDDMEIQLEKYYAKPRKYLFDATKYLGTGATGSVRTMVSREERKQGVSRLYAVKFRSPAFQRRRKGLWRQLERESFFLATALQHPHIVETIDLCSYGQSIAIVMEYCQTDLLKLFQMGRIKHEDRLCLFKQLLLGVAFMHENGVVHLDIKPENVLVDAHGIVKLGDLDCAEVVGRGNSHLERFFGVHEERRPRHYELGTRGYQAPEMFHAAEGLDLKKFDV